MCTLSFFLSVFSTSDVWRDVPLVTLKYIVLARLEIVENEFLFISIFGFREVRFVITEVFPYMIFGTTCTLPFTTDCSLGFRFASDSFTRHFLHWCHNSQAEGILSLRTILPTLCLSKHASERQTRPQARHSTWISVFGQVSCKHMSQEVSQMCLSLFW